MNDASCLYREGCRLLLGENIDSLTENVNLQVPQLHPDQVFDIPQVFESILQVEKQTSSV